MKQLFEKVQRLHVEAWNEKDPKKREELLGQIYNEDVKMYDNEFILDGLKAVSDFIGKLIAEDSLYHFAAAKDIQPLQNGARLFGHIKTGEGMLNSMDFFLMENDKVKHLYAFIEPAV